jgi:phosphoesterase RecJ-like protein
LKNLNNIADLKPLLEAAVKPKVIITTHHKPDADALGSSLGLYNYFLKKNIPAQIISPTDYGDFLKWMPNENSVINFEEFEEKSIDLITDADFIFCLDFNALKRIHKLGDIVKLAPAQKVLIDHHLEPEGFEDYRLWTTQASSTAELIFWFIELMGDVALIDADIASCLYAGIVTDTASFKHPSTTATTHRVAAVLLEKGAKSNKIYEAIYDNYSENRTRFIGFCLNEKLQILKEYNTALIVVTEDELKKFHILTGDSEGLVNYGLSISGILFSVLIVDRKVARKMSFRSKDKFPANEFARKYFNGGGHFNAAGGESMEAIELVEAKFKESLNHYKNYLTT